MNFILKLIIKNLPKKKLIILLSSSCLLFFIIIFLFFNIRSFYVTDSNLKNNIGYIGEDIKNVSITKEIDYNDRKIVMYNYTKGFSKDIYLGITILDKTFIKGLYRKVQWGSCQQNFGIMVCSNGNLGLENSSAIVYGYNPKKLAKFISLSIDGKIYSGKMSDEKYFITIFNNVEINSSSYGITFYDENKIDVSDKINDSGYTP